MVKKCLVKVQFNNTDCMIFWIQMQMNFLLVQIWNNNWPSPFNFHDLLRIKILTHIRRVKNEAFLFINWWFVLIKNNDLLQTERIILSIDLAARRHPKNRAQREVPDKSLKIASFYIRTCKTKVKNTIVGFLDLYIFSKNKHPHILQNKIITRTVSKNIIKTQQ